MARAFIGAEQFHDGEEAAKVASEIAGQVRDKRGQAEALVTLASGQSGRKKWKKAVTSLQDAAVLYRSLRDKKAEASTLGDMAKYTLTVIEEDEANMMEDKPMDKLQARVRDNEKLVATFVDLGATDTEGFAMALVALSGAMSAAKMYEGAIARAEEAQQIYVTLGELAGEAQALFVIAKTLLIQDAKLNKQDALTMARKAKEIAEESANAGIIKTIGDWLKINSRPKPKIGEQTTPPVDLFQLFKGDIWVDVDQYQGRATTVGKAPGGGGSSSSKRVLDGDGSTEYNPALLKTPAKHQALFSLAWHKMARPADRAKLVLPEHLRGAIA
jgi:hypothetical protein